MNIEFWATTFDFAGKILIAVMVILVHMKIRKFRKINTEVLREIYFEEIMGILGIVLLSAGYVLRVWFV
jgi:protein-S-isoprenylcysteine O-methyltransferase Ste14